MEEKVLENHERYVERLNFYKRLGYDLEKEREFIFEKSLSIDEPILEVGTGKGHFAVILAKHKHYFTTIDISREDQNIAQLNLAFLGLQAFAECKIENAEQLSFPDNSFNAIFSINVFHHLANPFIVLQEMVRVCAPNGKIIISDMTEKGMEIINTCHTMEGRKHDHSKHHLDEAEKYFINKGFNINTFSSTCQHSIVVHC